VSHQPNSPIGFLFFKLPPPPCAVLLVLWIRCCPLLKLPVDIRCIDSLFCCPVACRVVHFGPGIARMTRCEAAWIYHCGSSQNRLQLSALQSYQPHNPRYNSKQCSSSKLQVPESFPWREKIHCARKRVLSETTSLTLCIAWHLCLPARMRPKSLAETSSLTGGETCVCVRVSSCCHSISRVI
jgi:hypothetical protein